jgi:magnesium chelatase family protein
MHTKIISATTIGIDAYLVDVEVDLSYGMLQFFIVGLPDMAIKESKQRIITALKNCGIKLPERKITVNLAPADLKKEGTLFDLPIALGILQAGQYITISQQYIHETVFVGELSLDGSIKPVRGLLSIACDAVTKGIKRIVVPKENAAEAALCKDIEVIGVDHLVTLVGFLKGEIAIAPTASTFEERAKVQNNFMIDFNQVKGQFQAKRALQIAAAGRHNVLFIGSPGSGKSMLAERLPTIMPAMTFNEVIEATKVYSVSGKLGDQSLVLHRPFRNPHHTISQAGLVGGGSNPQPGEISLAHHGILFLDELTEFKKSTLEAMRQPIETKKVSIARAQQTVTFPASFLLIAALNPCPCGYLGDKRKQCVCAPNQIAHYIGKLSGPLLDRIDIQVTVPSVDYETIATQNQHASSAELYEKIGTAVARQETRGCWNAYLTSDQVDRYCVLSAEAQELIKKAFNQLSLSMRGYHKVLKLSRTIADLENSDMIETAHVREALMYRSLEQSRERCI